MSSCSIYAKINTETLSAIYFILLFNYTQKTDMNVSDIRFILHSVKDRNHLLTTYVLLLRFKAHWFC